MGTHTLTQPHTLRVVTQIEAVTHICMAIKDKNQQHIGPDQINWP